MNIKKLHELRPFDVLAQTHERVRCLVIGEARWEPFKRVLVLSTDDGVEFEFGFHTHGATEVEVE